MTEWLLRIYDFLIHVAETLPWTWSAALLGTFSCAFLSLWLRRYLPREIQHRSFLIHLGGLALGFAVTMTMVPTIIGFNIAIFVGLAAPWIGAVLTAFVVRRWPWLSDVLERD